MSEKKQKGKIASVLHIAVNGWLDDDVPRLSAALAYYAVFSIAPMLLLATSIAGAVFGASAVNGQVDAQLTGLVGPNAAKTIEGMVLSASKPQSSFWATVIGLVLLLYGSTSLFTELTASLNVIWHNPQTAAKAPTSIWKRLIKVRLLSLGMVLVIGFLLMISLVLGTIINAMHQWLGGKVDVPLELWGLLGFGVSALGEVVLFALVFRGLTHVKFPWKDVWVGALFTGILFEAGKWGLGWYLGRESFASTYGAAGSLMVFLMWGYYSAIILLTGAEITQAWSSVRHGYRVTKS